MNLRARKLNRLAESTDIDKYIADELAIDSERS